MKNRNGFTLVEIIATIVIIGVLSLVTVPAINRYITNSRKDSFVELGKNYINAYKTALISKNLAAKDNDNLTCKLPNIGAYTMIRIENIELENGQLVSPFKRSLASNNAGSRGFVLAINVSDDNKGTGTKDKIVYFFAAVDAGKNGVDQFISEEELSRNNVKRGTANTDRNTNYKKGLLGQITLQSSGKYTGNYSYYMECGGSYE